MRHYLIGLVLLVIFGIGFFYIAKNQPQKKIINSKPSYEYFWGDGCPHCANVDNFLTGWSGKSNINLNKMEVWKSQQNAELLKKRASSCGIPDDQVGVPLLYTPEGKCISGDQTIISYFEGLNN